MSWLHLHRLGNSDVPTVDTLAAKYAFVALNRPRNSQPAVTSIVIALTHRDRRIKVSRADLEAT